MRRTLREEALLGAAAPLRDETGAPFGPPVLPFTPWHHLLLLGFANPCFCGGRRTLRAVMQALWFMSPGFRAYAPIRYRLFKLRWIWSVSARAQPTPRALEALDRHLSALRLDRPPLPVARTEKRNADSVDGPHELAHLESVCRRHLGYTRAEFWHTPYAHTNQLLAIHFQTRTPDAPKFDRARDAQKKAWLARRRVAARKN